MSRASQLRAGVAEVELKPELGLATGDGAPQAKGFLTPLYVKALALANGEDEVAVVTLDMLGIDRPDAQRAAALAQERCGVPAANILMTCSHTHVAPSMLPSLHTYRRAFNAGWDEAAIARERAWVDVVVEAVAEAVCAAKGRLQEASIGVVTADLPWLIFNRRRHTRNYRVWTHWMKIPPDQAYAPEGPIDPDFGLFVVRDAGHRPLCLVWNLTGHNSFNFGDKYSADLPYTVQKELDQRLGEHVPSLYTPGASGNTNYFDYGQAGGLEKATDGVASAIVAVYREACTLPEVTLGARKAALLFAQRDVSRYWWRHDIETKLPGWKDYGPLEVERFQREAGENETYESDVQALRLGEAALVGLGGEVFVEFQMMIKERSPFRHTYVASYANDYGGYVATRRAFLGGSYEVWPTLNARIGREGGYMMVDKAVQLLQELYAE
jgi:neutral ceramidase